MYVSTSAPLPPNSQTRPSARSVQRYYSELATLALAIDKGRTAQNCAYAAAVSTQPVPTQIPNLNPAPRVIRPDARPQETAMDSANAAEKRAQLLLNTPNLTQAQRDAIADAPQVLNEPGPCAPVPEESRCPQPTAAPSWGNSATAYPSSACVSAVESVAEVVKRNPLLFLGLVVVGGFALNSLSD